MVILVGMLVGLVIHLLTGEEDVAYYYEDENNNNNGDDQQQQIAQSLLSFSPSVFFIVLLPPIIFNSGYHLRRDLFFRYITPICLFACLGTAACAAVVATLLYVCRQYLGFEPSYLELLAFGALISATDPVSTLAVFSSKKVDPQLFYLVFGESVINDAVGLVLFESLAHLIERQSSQELNIGEEISQFLFDFALGFVGVRTRRMY